MIPLNRVNKYLLDPNTEIILQEWKDYPEDLREEYLDQLTQNIEVFAWALCRILGIINAQNELR